MSANRTERVTVYLLRPKDRPSFQLQWIDPTSGGRRTKSAGTDDPGLAEKARADLEYELNHGIYASPDRATWAEFRQRFEAEYVASRRPNTRRNYAATLDAFEELAPVKSVAAITARTLSQFVARLRARPGRSQGTSTQASTVKVRMQFLQTALRWAVAHGYLAAAPAMPQVRVPRRTPQPVPDEVFAALVRQAGEDREMVAYMGCAWYAGLRRGEAHALCWSPSDEHPWVDLGRNRVVLPAAVAKSDADQWVPLDPALREMLAALPRRRGDDRVFDFRCRSGLAAPPLTVGQRVRRLAELAGVRASYKTLRRGFGCRYAGRVPAQVLQRLMRHADIKTTLAYYANLDDAVEAAVLGRPNGGPNGTVAAPAATSHPDGAKE